MLGYNMQGLRKEAFNSLIKKKKKVDQDFLNYLPKARRSLNHNSTLGGSESKAHGLGILSQARKR